MKKNYNVFDHISKLVLRKHENLHFWIVNANIKEGLKLNLKFSSLCPKVINSYLKEL